MEMKIATRQCADQKGAQRHFHYFLTVDLEETPHLFCDCLLYTSDAADD